MKSMKKMVILFISLGVLYSCSMNNRNNSSFPEETCSYTYLENKDTIMLYLIIDSVVSAFGKKYGIIDYVKNEFIQIPKDDSIHQYFLFNECCDTIYLSYTLRQEDFYIRYAIWNKKNYISGGMDSCEYIIESILKNAIEEWNTSMLNKKYFATDRLYRYSARIIMVNKGYDIEFVRHEYYDHEYSKPVQGYIRKKRL